MEIKPSIAVIMYPVNPYLYRLCSIQLVHQSSPASNSPPGTGRTLMKLTGTVPAQILHYELVHSFRKE